MAVANLVVGRQADRTRRVRWGATALLLTLAGAGLAKGNAAEHAAQRPPALQTVGQGELRWFGIRIYEATLSTPEGRFAQFDQHDSVSLEIRYLKNIAAERLVDSARQEWTRLGLLDPQTIERWCAQVAGIWPSVTPGDRITMVVRRDGPTLFYFNDEFVGVVEEDGFGPKLLQIWLHPDTRSKSLRQSLLGERA